MKIIIVYASSGAGHQKAAEAIFKVLKEEKNVAVHLIDSLDYTAPLFHYLYPRAYLFLVRYLPSVWGFFYDGLNLVFIGPLLRRLRRLLNGLNGKKLERFFLAEQPDLIVSTHFFASEVASALKKKKKLATRLITIVTDFVIHSVWVTPQTNHYVVATSDTEEALLRRQVPRERIAILGIPVDPVFEEREDRVTLSRKIGISPERFTVLLASGGFGIGPIEKLVRCLSRHDVLQLLVVCGRNRSLYRRLKSQISLQDQRIVLYEFVNNIHELMSVSDCMVSKSGGLTMSEALAKHLPTFILYPIPGQEGGNRDVLVRHQVALSLRDIRQLEEYFCQPDRLREMLTQVQKRISHFKKPHSAKRVTDFILSVGGRHG